MPHATRVLWPSTTNGLPGTVLPTTSSPADAKCISYHTDGNSICKCGSFANIGRPLCVFRPETTQLLLPPLGASEFSHSSPGMEFRGFKVPGFQGSGVLEASNLGTPELWNPGTLELCVSAVGALVMIVGAVEG